MKRLSVIVYTGIYIKCGFGVSTLIYYIIIIIVLHAQSSKVERPVYSSTTVTLKCTRTRAHKRERDEDERDIVVPISQSNKSSTAQGCLQIFDIIRYILIRYTNTVFDTLDQY